MSIELTEELRREMDQAGDDPVRIVHPVTGEEFVVVRANLFDRLKRIAEAEVVDPSFYEFEEKAPPA